MPKRFDESSCLYFCIFVMSCQESQLVDRPTVPTLTVIPTANIAQGDIGWYNAVDAAIRTATRFGGWVRCPACRH